MGKKENPPKGSTRKEMTDAELEWLKNFNQAFEYNDAAALKKLSSNPEMVTDVKRRQDDEHNARRRDIYSNQKAVHIQAGHEGYDESFDNFIEGDSSVEHYVEDATLAPAYPKRERNSRYTPEDYCKPGIPDEDGLIDAIDAERAEIERKKIKQFPCKPKEVKGDAS